MKEWKRLALIAMLAPLAACSQGGSSSPTLSGAVCSAAQPAMAGMSTQAFDGGSSTSSQDPFSVSKIVLDSESSPFSGVSTSAVESRRLEAGTAFTVSVREACENPGALASAVLNSQEQEDATPAGVRSFDFALPRAMTMAQLTRAADEDSCVVGLSEAGEANVESMPADPLIETQAHLKMLEADAAYDKLKAAMATTKPVVIAVIDTGLDTDHEDMKGVLWKNPGEIAGNGIDDDRNGYKDDVNGYNFEDRVGNPKFGSKWGGHHHGTHVAGLAAAQGGNGVGGMGVMANGVRIMALNVFGSTPGARVSDVANAIRYAADNGAEVINLSLGGSGRNATYESAINYALSKGSTILTASGNNGSQLGAGFFMAPGSYGRQFAGMINVGSVDAVDSNISTFSNWSPTFVELGAPGSEDSRNRRGVLSTYPGNKYIRAQGTSMATPVAAGGAAMAIALLRARGYNPSPATVEGVLEVSSRTLDHLRAKIRDGRSMNLKNLADFIENSYPQAKVEGQDPGVPGYDTCAIATAQAEL